jgi:hypothetical protein
MELCASEVTAIDEMIADPTSEPRCRAWIAEYEATGEPVPS